MFGKKKRSLIVPGVSQISQKRQKLSQSKTYFRQTLTESGLKVADDKCTLECEVSEFVRKLKRTLEKHADHPLNITEFINAFKAECNNLDTLKLYLFPNVVKVDEQGNESHNINDSLFKILLSVSPLQKPLIEYMFEKAKDFAIEENNCQWIQMILRSVTLLDSFSCGDLVSSNLIDLLDIATDRSVRLEIISALPDIIGDQQHGEIAVELSKFLSEDHALIPAILECLSYLIITDKEYGDIQKKAFNILRTSAPFHFFPNLVKFLLMPGRMDEEAYLEVIRGIRTSLEWTVIGDKNAGDIATSQILTSSAIRMHVTASKLIATLWFKSITSCKTSSDHKPIDIVILILLYSTYNGREKVVENVFKKHIKLSLMKNEILDMAFQKFKPIIKNYLQDVLQLINGLLKMKTESTIMSFATHWYTLLFTQLEDCRQSVVAELLHQGLGSEQYMMGMLNILSTISAKDMSSLKPHSIQMLSLLEKLDDLKLNELRTTMNLLCGLAYAFENSPLRDDMHMIIRKQLGSSNHKLKFRGIIAAIHAVKYLVAIDDDNNDDRQSIESIDYGTTSHLPEGNIKEAAQLIELVSRSTERVSEMSSFFYDELSLIISSADKINKQFLSWLSDAVTNDLQTNFIVGEVSQPINDIELSMQYCLNAQEDIDEEIAVNIAVLSLESGKDNSDICILPSLFQLVTIVHSRQNFGNLCDIDALLGCPVIMPVFDPETCIDEMDQEQVFGLLDCLIHCINWFRELVNGFAEQNSTDLKMKVIKRLKHIEDMERMVNTIMYNCKGNYKPPISTFVLAKAPNDQITEKVVVQKQKVAKGSKSKEKVSADDSVLPPTAKSQAEIAVSAKGTKNVAIVQKKIHFRSLNFSIATLLNEDLKLDEESDQNGMTIENLNFILYNINIYLESVLISRVKKVTALTKSDNIVYDSAKAIEHAKKLTEIMPRILIFLEQINSVIKTQMNETSNLFTSKCISYQTCLEHCLTFFTIYFRWTGFKNQNYNLLRNGLRILAAKSDKVITKTTSISELYTQTAKYFKKCTEFCIQISTAVTLVTLVKALFNLSENGTILTIVEELSTDFLSQSWQMADGSLERGTLFNQNIDLLVGSLFTKPNIQSVKTLTFQIKEEAAQLQSKNDVLKSFCCISKSNFSILFRGLCGSVYEAAKNDIEKGLTNNEHLDLWKQVAVVTKTLSEIAKMHENRNNLASFLKKSIFIIKLFISQGMPIMEMKLKNETDLVIEVLRLMQQTTRFLQTLCCHSRLKKDTTLIAKVPQMRALLETLVYKVKAALAANNCTEAFWMGNLKNKNLQGDIILSQDSEGDKDSVNEDNDDQLPEDDTSDLGSDDEELLNPDSKSISDMI